MFCFKKGKDLAKQFKVPPGKTMGVIIDKLIDWQLLNMEATLEDATNYVQEELKNYTF